MDDRRLSAKERKMLRDTHGGYGGRNLQDKIRALMDKQNKRSRTGENQDRDYARLEGMAATLAILRNTPQNPSSVAIEIALSNQRMGYDGD